MNKNVVSVDVWYWHHNCLYHMHVWMQDTGTARMMFDNWMQASGRVVTLMRGD
jgi:hypothetical protein